MKCLRRVSEQGERLEEEVEGCAKNVEEKGELGTHVGM